MKRNMKMHNVAVGLIAGVIVMLSAAACGETEADPDLFGSSELRAIIRDDFYGRYSGGVTVTDVLTYDDGKTYVWFTDTDGLPCCSIYKGETWIFTQKEYDKTDFAFLGQLPVKISRAYIRTGVDNENYTIQAAYVREVSRRGIEKSQFEFEFYEPYGGENSFLTHNLTISADGEVLDHSYGGINESFWWYDVDYCIEYVDSNYPEATILGAINNSGGNVLFINDGGVRKSVRFRQDSCDQIWYETVWQLDDDTVLPENVAREYAEYREENPDFAYTSVFYVERKDGAYYGLEMETGRLTGRTVFLKI
jgi:hypothetical protein